MSERRIVVDPVTRIEGHLRVQATLGDDGRIADSMSTGTMWRGLEVILKGRDPRDAWAFVERICGVCTGIHALAAVRSVEDALGIKIPKNANIMRNLVNATLYVHDHLVHFYQLSALDWVDVVSALEADPRETAAIQQKISPSHPLASVGYFRDVQNRLKKFVASGQLGIFKNGYWGHPAMKLPPAVNLLAVTHYLEVLDFQKEIIKIHTILGGKNPHPNYLVGGMACPINMHDTGAQGTMVNEVTLNYMRDIAKRSLEIVENVYLPDIKAIAGFYPEWFKYGAGLSNKNVLCYGEFPEIANDWSDASMQLPRGAIINGNLNEVHDVDLRDLNEIQEFVDHSWYRYPDAGKGLHPWEGITEQAFELSKGSVGDKTKFEWLGADGKYSWIKSPRWKGHMMEVGPLSRLVMGVAKNVPHIKEPAMALLEELNAPLEAVFSTLGRHAARALECRWAAQKMVQHPCGRRMRRQHGEVGAQHLAQGSPRRGLLRGPARRPRPLVRHQGHAHRQLAGHRADDVERVAALSLGRARRLRAEPHRHPGRRRGPAARNHPHDPQLRPVPGLRHSSPEPEGRGTLQRQGALMGGRYENRSRHF